MPTYPIPVIQNVSSTVPSMPPQLEAIGVNHHGLRTWNTTEPPMSNTSTIAKTIAIADLSLPLVAKRHLVGIRHQSSVRRHFEPFCEPKCFPGANCGRCGRVMGKLKALMPILVLLVNVPKRLVVGSFSCLEEWIGKTHAVPC